jgi:hypothetical protein
LPEGEALIIDANIIEEFTGHIHFGLGLNISRNIVAVSEVAAHYEETVKALFKCLGHCSRIDPTGAHESDNLYLRGVL